MENNLRTILINHKDKLIEDIKSGKLTLEEIIKNNEKYNKENNFGEFIEIENGYKVDIVLSGQKCIAYFNKDYYMTHIT